MGDYLDTLGFNSNGGDVTVTKSNDYSTNGEYSAKVEIPSNKNGYVRFAMGNQSNLRGQTVTFSVDCKTDSLLKLELYEYYNNRYTATVTYIPADSEGTFKITKVINENTTNMLVDISHDTSNSNAVFYTDNWQVIK